MIYYHIHIFASCKKCKVSGENAHAQEPDQQLINASTRQQIKKATGNTLYRKQFMQIQETIIIIP